MLDAAKDAVVAIRAGVTVRDGDLFESRAQTLVNTVNCVGVMGTGIALDFKRAFPPMFEDYVERCAAGQVRLGEPYLWPPVSAEPGVPRRAAIGLP